MRFVCSSNDSLLSGFGSTGALALASALSESAAMRRLERLSLADNRIGDEGASALANALASSRKRRHTVPYNIPHRSHLDPTYLDPASIPPRSRLDPASISPLGFSRAG
jgi:hypothetical protein